LAQHGMQKYVSGVFILMGLIMAASHANAADCGWTPVPYEASYIVNRKGKTAGSMRVKLVRTGEDRFTYTMDTRVRRGIIKPKILQQSEFTWKNGWVMPDRFQLNLKAAIYRRTEIAEFDWQNMQATGKKKGDHFERPIRAGVEDKLTVYLRLAKALCEGQKNNELDVVSGPVAKPHVYRFLADEDVETPRGQFATIHLRRGEPESEKQTDLWYAQETHFLPVKMVYRDKDDIMIMSLSELSF